LWFIHISSPDSLIISQFYNNKLKIFIIKTLFKKKIQSQYSVIQYIILQVITAWWTETSKCNLKNVRHYRKVYFEFYVARKFNNLLSLRFGLIIDFRQDGRGFRNENSNRRLEWSLFYVSAFRFCSPTRSYHSVRYLLRNSFCPTHTFSSFVATLPHINVLCFRID